ncbi:ABC transporter permease [Actinomyces qiguomingii]|uniref:ABC transporter permease n=1 Tax=Actinomyces qiguomingii TaxID=2057800 RepID=UPI000CA051F4|nr:ABC transporter permease [Actinomyces qiguomingii]
MRPGPSLLAAATVAVGVSAVAGALAVDDALPAAPSDTRLAHAYVHALLWGMTALVALAVMIIVMNAFAASLRRRTHALALLRATGTAPTPVAVAVLLQATAIGLLGAALGMLGGIGVIRLLDTGFTSRGGPLVDLSTAPRPAAIIIGLLAAVCGAAPPAIGAALTPPAGSTPPDDAARPALSRGVAGAVLSLLAMAGIGVTWRVTDLPQRVTVLGVSASLLLLGVLLALPWALRPFVMLLGLPARSTTSGGLAVRRLAAAPRQGAALAAPPLLAAAATCLAAPTAASLRKSLNQPGYLDVVLDALPAMLVGMAVLAGICAAGAVSAHASRRTAETTLLRALGQTRGQSVGQFLCEALLAGAGGVILGGICGLLLSTALSTVLADRGLDEIVIPWMQLLAPALVGGVGGVLAALAPALRATRPPTGADTTE